MALTNYKSMVLLDEYLNYLEVIKGRSHNTVIEYRTDILMFLDFICEKLEIPLVEDDLEEIDDIFNMLKHMDME